MVALHTYQEHDTRLPEYRLLEWVKENTEKDAVIGTMDPALIVLIPSVASRFNFVPLGVRSCSLAKESELRYHLVAQLLGTSNESFNKLFTSKDSGTTAWTFPNWILNGDFTFLTQSFFEELLQDLSKFDLAHERKIRKLDYLIAPLNNNFVSGSIIYSNEAWKLIKLH